jgi:CAAX prenyl protease-like protein
VRLLQKIFSGSPALPRVGPFIIFVLITAGQGKFGPSSAYWFYLAKTLAGAWLIYEMQPLVAEMRWAFSWEAVVVGAGVFLLWIGINGEWALQNSLWVKWGITHAPVQADSIWDPQIQFGGFSGIACFFLTVHIVGMTLVVPPLEEVFYRSFLYRYVANQNFLTMPLDKFLPWPFLVTVAVFGFSHNEWLAGILCGAAYQWLVIRKNRLGDAMTAHAITNFLLGGWVVWRGAWHFW